MPDIDFDYLRHLSAEIETAVAEAAADIDECEDLVYHDVALSLCYQAFGEHPAEVNEWWRCNFGQTWEQRMRQTGGAL